MTVLFTGKDAPFFPAKNPYGQWYANFGNVGNRNSAAATTDGGRDERENLTTRIDFKALVDIWKGITFEGTASFQKKNTVGSVSHFRYSVTTGLEKNLQSWYMKLHKLSVRHKT